MSTAFAVLALVSLLALLIGMIRPRIVRLKNRWMVFLVFFGSFIVFSGLTSAFMSPEEKAKLEAEAAKREAAAKVQELIDNQKKAEAEKIASEQKAKSDAEKAESDKKAAEEQSKLDAEKAKAEAEANKPYETTAKKLFAEYEANEVATDERIGKKPVLISGTVTSIDKDFTNNIIIKLGTSNQFMSAMMRMEDSEKEKAMSLSKGQNVRILCKNMSRLIGSPSGRRCVFSE